MGGYINRVLWVDLTERVFSEETLDSNLIHEYIGGRGFGVKILYDNSKPGIDPLAEDNQLIFIAGPLAGTNAQSFSRWKVFFKSPLTGGYFKSSGGGSFAAEMKFAGFDAVIIKGISDRPVYLWIHDGKYELRDATYLWGLDCDDTHTLIREELHDPKIRIACIGPAGENKVRYAGIFSDRRTAGRGGGGTVMGARKLKAIAIRGSGRINIADTKAFTDALREQIRVYRDSPEFKTFVQSGTQHVDFTNLLGMYPTKNFREGVLPNWEMVDGPEFNKLRVRHTSCYKCMLQCGSISKVTAGKYAGAWSEGPEYETIWSFTGPMNHSDIGLTIAADKLCDDLGLDTISTGNTIGFAYELYERGFITKEDTDGLELLYGNGEPILRLIRQIAYREGFGDLLAEGTREAARRIGKGTEQYAMQVKGLEMPAYDPRGAKAHGLNLLTCSLGADHNSGFASQEIEENIVIDGKEWRFTNVGKGEVTKRNQDLIAIYETGIHCNFASLSFMKLSVYAKLLSAVTGINDFADLDYLWLVGERINNLERMFNIREGFGRRNDVFPTRITNEVLPFGPSAAIAFEEDILLNDYYAARGWDVETGIPTRATLDKLGLSFTVEP